MSTYQNPSGSRLEVVVTADGRRIRRFHVDTSKIAGLPSGGSALVVASDRWNASPDRKEVRHA